jgi:hypothetical protein
VNEQSEQPVYASFGFTDEEWGLLTGLPQSVLTAASAAQSDSARRTMAEHTAGLEAISRGRESGDPLVAAIAREVISRVGDPDAGAVASVIRPSDPAGYAAQVLDRVRAARALLTERVSTTHEGSAEAYKYWLVSITEKVVSAATSGGVLGVGGDLITSSERRFREDLTSALYD